MTKILKFKIEINNLQDKIWRIIEITDSKTVADLAYTILSAFDSLAYHLYQIEYKNNIYDCWIDITDDRNILNATLTKLQSLNLKINDKMTMTYDYGSPTTFIITFISDEELKRGSGRHYPYIIDGKGRGMIDDISEDELKEIIKDIDIKGFSNHNFTPGYERSIKYDYRDFDIKTCNILLKGEIEEIKYKYEYYE